MIFFFFFFVVAEVNTNDPNIGINFHGNYYSFFQHYTEPLLYTHTHTYYTLK